MMKNVLLVSALFMIAGAAAMDCAPIRGMHHIRPEQKGFDCVARLAPRLVPATPALNEKQTMALASFATDVGCHTFGKVVKSARFQVKRLPRAMLHHAMNRGGQSRRNAEVALFYQPVSCVTPGTFRSASKFNAANLPPHTHGRVVTEAADTGRVNWHRDRKAAAPAPVVAEGACVGLDGYVYTHSKRYCCPAAQPELIGLLCYETCKPGFEERAYGCYPTKASTGSSYERMPKLSKWRPRN